MKTINLKVVAPSAWIVSIRRANKGDTFLYGFENCKVVMSLFGREEGQIIPPYKGPLSSYAEWHALAIGFYHGFSEDKAIPLQVMDGNPDVSSEPHMAKYGFPLGVMTKYALVVLAFKYGVEPLI